MTQEEELKIGEVGYKKSSDSSERKSRRGKHLNHWLKMITEQDNWCY